MLRFTQNEIKLHNNPETVKINIRQLEHPNNIRHYYTKKGVNVFAEPNAWHCIMLLYSAINTDKTNCRLIHSLLLFVYQALHYKTS